MHENSLLAELPALFRNDDASVDVGVGADDCAHVRSGGNNLAFSVDVFAEGSHFLAGDDPALVAGKALGASVSDLAASACRPRWALVGLCLKQQSPAGWAEAFAAGLAEAAKRWGVSIVGGDTVSSPSSTVVSVTVAGEPMPGGPVLRGGGRPGDILAVTGMLGGSILGRHLAPEPRVREMADLMRFCSAPGNRFTPTACMDLSDGLAMDLSRLCAESGTGAVVDEDLLPVSPDAAALARKTGWAPVHHALTDGEDFELLLAMPPETWKALVAAGTDAGAICGCIARIGRLTEKSEGLLLRHGDGSFSPLEAEGFEHSW